MDLVCTLLTYYVLLVFLRVVVSWFPMDPDSGFAAVVRAIDVVIEPLLGPIRRTLPPVRVGGAALDLSPIALLLAVRIVLAILGC